MLLFGVVAEALDNGVGGDIEGESRGGSGGHVGDGWLAREEGSGGERGGARSDFGFSAFFIESGIVDVDIGGGIAAVGEGGFGAIEVVKGGEVGIVAILDDNLRLKIL